MTLAIIFVLKYQPRGRSPAILLNIFLPLDQNFN